VSQETQQDDKKFFKATCKVCNAKLRNVSVLPCTEDIQDGVVFSWYRDDKGVSMLGFLCLKCGALHAVRGVFWGIFKMMFGFMPFAVKYVVNTRKFLASQKRGSDRAKILADEMSLNEDIMALLVERGFIKE
jgi:hypothetical protein